MDNSLMIYENNDILLPEKNETSFAAIITVIVAFLSVLAAGGTVSGEAAELLPALAATAVPGLFAWVLSYLAANAENADEEVTFDE